MNSLSATNCFSKYPFLQSSKRRRLSSRIPPVHSTLKTPPSPLKEYARDDVLQDFLKERKLSGDFVTKVTDVLWLKGVLANAKEKQEFDEIGGDESFSGSQLLDEPGEESEGGFLKLKRTNEWLLGENDAAPVNKKMTLKVVH